MLFDHVVEWLRRHRGVAAGDTVLIRLVLTVREAANVLLVTAGAGTAGLVVGRWAAGLGGQACGSWPFEERLDGRTGHRWPRGTPQGHDEAMGEGTAAHWDSAYRHGESNLSWYQPEPAASLRMIKAAKVDRSAAVIDVGGGASHLVDALLDCRFTDVSVLDLSSAGLEAARNRLDVRAQQVHWLVADVHTWRPQRGFDVWHDRAVFHFQTAPAERQSYLTTMDRATTSGAVAIFGTFAPEGPPQCSGLPVARYDVDQLATEIGPGWELLSSSAEEHTTPHGTTQPFTWALFRKW